MRRRGVALTGLAMIIAGGIWAALAMAASSEVEIKKPSGKEEIVSIEESHTRLEDLPIRRREQGGPFACVRPKGDWRWRPRVDEHRSRRLDGSERIIRAEETPIFYIKGSNDEVTFYRPKTENGGAETRSASGGNLDMTYRVPLKVDSSDDSPKAGQTVTYSVSVPGGGPQSAYEFTWTPSSGTGGTGSTFDYTYPETSGEVTINVTAKRGSDNQTVGAAVKSNTVEAPPEEDTSGTGGTGFGSSGYDSGYDTSYDYPSASDYDSNFPDAKIPEDSVPDDVKTPDAETTPLEDAGVSVSGELLSATTPLPPSSGEAGETPEESAPDPEAAVEEAEEISAPGALIAAGVVVGLLGLGAGREMETVRPRRIRRPDLSGLRRLLPPWK